MSKYRNKDGIELSYEGHSDDTHVDLVKEVISEAVRLISTGGNKKEVIQFLTENFSINEQTDR
jgi:hypothetical protein|tara:strand:+ start:1506 stop:1694 length:189 start_codon:yes stop_codon:yes gene_type:complete